MNGRRIRFLKDFAYKPEPRVTILYQAGTVRFVRKECAELAIKRGRAEYTSLKGPPSGVAAAIAAKVKGKASV